MALIYYGLAIMSLIGAGAVLFWARKGEERMSLSMVAMALALGILGLLMLILGLTA